MDKIHIYTDGSSRGNPGPGGFGAILMWGDKLKEIVINSKYYWCLQEFAEELIEFGQWNMGNYTTIIQVACDHCMRYTDYQPLQGLLIELCVEKE